jgi:DHA1 family tetracycline resistance protein-like MFS transporter
MMVGVLNILVQGLLVKPTVARFGERGAVYAGLLFGICGFTAFALAPSAFWMWVSLPVFALWGLASPGLQGLMSRRVSAHEQGKLQGANGSITSIAGLIGPTLFTESFAYFIDPHRTLMIPGVSFYLAAALLIPALLLALLLPRRAHVVAEAAP